MKTGPDSIQSKGKGDNLLLLVALLIATPFIVLFYIGSQEVGIKGKSSSYIPSVGAIARLNTGAAVIIMPTSKAAYDELIKAFVAKDTYGWNLLILSGRALVVKSGTKVRVLDLSVFEPTEVRILEGEYAGRRAWIEHKLLKSP